MKNPSIFIGLREIANYYYGLHQGFISLGIKSYFLEEKNHSFSYNREKVNGLATLLPRLTRLNNQSSNVALIGFTRILIELLKFLLLLKYCVLCDVFIFGYGRSFFKSGLDLKLLKALNKKIIFVFNGSDSRPAYLDGALLYGMNHNLDDVDTSLIKKIVAHQVKRIKLIEQYADFIVNHNLSAQLFHKEIVLWLEMGIPLQTDILEKVGKQSSSKSKKTVILHSPSNVTAKGTIEIRHSINNLIEKGFQIEYIEIVNQPHQKVIAELERCDFVIDQLYSDTPLAGFATEAATMGKAVIVGGNFDKSELVISSDKIPKSYLCRPDSIEHAIAELINNQKLRDTLANENKHFVFNEWNNKIVASRFLQLMISGPDNNWLYDPTHLESFAGYGLSDSSLNKLLKKYVKEQGWDALYLEHNEKLKARIKGYLGQF